MRTSSWLALCLGSALMTVGTAPGDAPAERNKELYVEAVTRGVGFLPWQKPDVSEAESGFRADVEARKDAMLAARLPVAHPVFFATAEVAQARRNISSAEWARTWFEKGKELADFLVAQPPDYVTAMISDLTPWHGYGFTCPNCVGRKSQEGSGARIVDWDHRSPDVLRCAQCGQTYPDARFPETATLVCPRMGQTFTFYRNDEQRLHPEDRSGKLAWQWVRHPMHVSFSGLLRQQRAMFMVGAAHCLGLLYQLTGDARYAARTVEILDRLAHCYRNWLYHDYWDTVADCDPLYAAWHDKNLELEWKRHLCADAYLGDDLDKAAMLQGYWGAGRYAPSTDGVGAVATLCEAYDAVYDVSDADGRPLWTPAMRRRVERDLLLEWVIGAEPFVGGAGQATETNNKAPRVYKAQAAVAKCLGLASLADTALRGYEAIRDEAFLYDGFSRESPAYTDMYLGALVEVPETLHGFRWPEGLAGREGTVDLFTTDARLRSMLKAAVDTLRPDGRLLPLEDTGVEAAHSPHLLEIGLKRSREHFLGRLPALYRGRSPGEFALLYLDAGDLALDTGLSLPELYFPAWMTAILRHGEGPEAAVLALNFSPPGGHRHYDNLTLFYADGGDTLLGDLGYVGDMPVNSWIGSTKSHNLVLVDEEGQQFGGERPRVPSLELMVSSPRVSVVEASSAVYAQCREYRRRIVLFKGPEARTFALDVFRVKGGSKHDYRLWSELASSDAAEGALVVEHADLPPEPPLPEVAGSLAREDIYGLRDVRSASAPAAPWRALWRDAQRQYRLWMLSPADTVQAANGPGQELHARPGRRVRYLDVIRNGANLESTFVALHEPSAPDGLTVIRDARLLEVPPDAGPDAVAVRIDSAWGTYRVFGDFAREAEVDGVRFEGMFGVVCEDADGAWLLAAGAGTLQAGDFGFSGRSARWTSAVAQGTETELVAASPCPSDYTFDDGRGCTPYVLVHDGRYRTGFPVSALARTSLRVERFPLLSTDTFDLPLVRVGQR